MKELSYKKEKSVLSAELPNGSVLGSTLCNVFFGEVLGLVYEEGGGYVDNIGIMILIDKWMIENGMSLVEEKTKAKLMKGPRNREGVKIILMKKEIEAKKS